MRPASFCRSCGSRLHTTFAPTNKYRADVDGLRAVAVVAVVAYHLDSAYMPGGFVGVDVFFVISGYVVAGSLLARPSPSVADFLLAFYVRRVKRLFPALLVMLLLLYIYVMPSTTVKLDTRVVLWIRAGASLCWVVWHTAASAERNLLELLLELGFALGVGQLVGIAPFKVQAVWQVIWLMVIDVGHLRSVEALRWDCAICMCDIGALMAVRQVARVLLRYALHSVHGVSSVNVM